jgi:hypothetical protein
MGPLSGLRLFAALYTVVLVAGLLAWALRLDALRADWRAKFKGLDAEAALVLTATRDESDNPALVWRDVPAQIAAIGKAKRDWQGTANLQSTRIDELGLETARLKALGEEARRKAEALIAKRDRTIARLSDQAIEPGDRADCVAQLHDVETALDLVYREGL